MATARLPPETPAGLDSASAKRLVVIGSSAGGIEALSTLVSNLPADFPAPIIIAQHLDPRKTSHLEEILRRHAAVAVRTVARREALRPGIFVVPSNQDVRVTAGAICLEDAGSRGPVPSVDRLFASAAEAYGEDLIAVILSGTGSDGSSGARVVHDAGGTVIVQNPDTAAFGGMPRSLAPTTIDVVAELTEIGPVLTRLVLAGVGVSSEQDERRDVAFVVDTIRHRTGMDFREYRKPTIIRRLHRRMAATGCPSVAEYCGYIESHPEEEAELVRSFLIKVTSFFRDPATFAHLRTAVLPELVEAARAEGRELRIWSAGCATGEEAYSLAVALCEQSGGAHPQLPIRIFATDLDALAIAFARRGTYPAAAFRTLGSEIRDRYFVRFDNEWQATPTLREMIVFGHHDITRQPPFPNADLVVCRNVLIYMTASLQKRVLERLAFAVREGGYLVLGTGESARPVKELFASVESRFRIYRRSEIRVPVRPPALQAPVGSAVRRPPPLPVGVGGPVAPPRSGRRRPMKCWVSFPLASPLSTGTMTSSQSIPPLAACWGSTAPSSMRTSSVCQMMGSPARCVRPSRAP